MARLTDISIKTISLYFLPVKTRVPLKFGTEVLHSVTCARARVTVENGRGEIAEGWGETPLSVQWVWPSSIPYETRHQALQDFTKVLANVWKTHSEPGHALEIGFAVAHHDVGPMLQAFNEEKNFVEPMPLLAALVCASLFDIAVHDAYGKVNGVPIYKTYNRDYLNRDLSAYLQPAEGANVSFKGRWVEDFLNNTPPAQMPAWHLVGGKDAIDKSDLEGTEPNDGYPVLLADWIKRDGLKCLKIKLRGDDSDWDYHRLVQVAEIGLPLGIDWLTTDFNCTVKDPAYVNEILDRLVIEHPRIYGSILYVEQPFPYDLEKHQIDVHSVAARKPLFMDESAHDWELIKLGRTLGWTGVALKTCKTQTGALLSLCWARAHGMTLMVQDLTNPMLAQIPHVQLAAHANTIMGVETNSMQFYPEASLQEEAVHPGLYRRRGGKVDLSSLKGNGFGYQVEKIERKLPAAVLDI